MKCRYCENPDAILTTETCCTGCCKLTEIEHEDMFLRDILYNSPSQLIEEKDYKVIDVEPLDISLFPEFKHSKDMLTKNKQHIQKIVDTLNLDKND